MKPEIEDTDIIIKRVPNDAPPALPISGELTDDELENVIGGASPQTFNKWRIKILMDRTNNVSAVGDN